MDALSSLPTTCVEIGDNDDRGVETGRNQNAQTMYELGSFRGRNAYEVLRIPVAKSTESPDMSGGMLPLSFELVGQEDVRLLLAH